MSRIPLPTMSANPDYMPPARRQPTILDVASRAGVSKSTVSNVVRGLPGVSEATRVRVRMAIDQLGYRPNVLARQLVQQRGSILGVVVGDLANPFFAEMAKSVERHAAARGYTAMFCNTEGDSASELAGIETLLAQRVAGIVFFAFSGDSRTMRETLQHHVPAVFLSCHEDWGDVVAVDDALGGRLLFPPSFVGRGDMSRGGLLLRSVRSGTELEYAPLRGAVRHGARPPRLPRY